MKHRLILVIGANRLEQIQEALLELAGEPLGRNCIGSAHGGAVFDYLCDKTDQPTTLAQVIREIEGGEWDKPKTSEK